MLQGKVDATLGTTDSILQFEVKGQRISVLADLMEKGVFISSAPVTTTREFLKKHSGRAKALLQALSEGIALGKRDRELAGRIFRKYMKIENPKILEGMHKTYFMEIKSVKPYPHVEAIETDIEDLGLTNPKIKGRKASDFMDTTLLNELEREGFFARILR